MKRLVCLSLSMACALNLGCGQKTEDSSVATNGSAAAAPTNAPNSNLAAPSTGVPAATNLNQPSGVAASPTGAVNQNKVVRANAQGTPEEVVAAFLDGMKHGNAKLIESLLSTPARNEIASKGLDISPIGSPQAIFRIGDSELPNPQDPNTVLVTSYWLEPGTAAAPAVNATPATEATPDVEFEVVWALVKEQTGWKICEMAVDTHEEGAEIQVVNFENLADLAAPEVPRTASLPNAPAAGASVPTAANPGFGNGAGSVPSLPQLNGNAPASNGGFGSPSGSLPALPASGSNSLPPQGNTGFGGGSSLPAVPPASGSGFGGAGAPSSGGTLPPLPTFGNGGTSSSGSLPTLPRKQ